MLPIREATAADAAALAKVHTLAWQEAYRGLLPQEYLDRLSVEARCERWRQILQDTQPAHSVWVAGQEQLVGFAAGGLERSNDPDYRGELYSLYVLRSHHRRGIGRRLLQAVVARLIAHELPSLLVWVLSQNPARSFYASLGGKPLGTQTITIADQPLEETAYGWTDAASILRHP